MTHVQLYISYLLSFIYDALHNAVVKYRKRVIPIKRYGQQAEKADEQLKIDPIWYEISQWCV